MRRRADNTNIALLSHLKRLAPDGSEVGASSACVAEIASNLGGEGAVEHDGAPVVLLLGWYNASWVHLKKYWEMYTRPTASGTFLHGTCGLQVRGAHGLPVPELMCPPPRRCAPS
jgi:hypothetical protein